MFSIFGSRPVATPVAVVAPCPVESTGRTLKHENFEKAVDCLEDLKRRKAGVVALNGLFRLLDAARTQFDALLESEHTMTDKNRDDYLEKLRETIKSYGSTIESSSLSKEEKLIAHQYLSSLLLRRQSELRKARLTRRSEKITAENASKLGKEAVAARKKAEELALVASKTAKEAEEAAKAGKPTDELIRIAQAVARNSEAARKRAEYYEGRVRDKFARRAGNATGAGNAALTAYANATAGAGTGGARRTRRAKKQKKSRARTYRRK